MEKYCKQAGVFALSVLVSIARTVLVMPRGTCRFYPSCSNYAKEAIASLPFHRAAALIVIRLLRCTPFSTGGYDPVPGNQQQGKGCRS